MHLRPIKLELCRLQLLRQLRFPRALIVDGAIEIRWNLDVSTPKRTNSIAAEPSNEIAEF